MEKLIPQIVQEAASKYLSKIEYTISYMGIYHGKEAYSVGYSNDLISGGGGLPIVFLYDGTHCEQAGFDAPGILSYFSSIR